MRKGCDGENMDVQWGYMLFRGLHGVQGGYMEVQEGYMMKKIMTLIVGTNVVASRQPERRPTGRQTTCANIIQGV